MKTSATDETYMRQCLRLAEQAKQNGNTAVGSLIVLNGAVVAEGLEGDESLPVPLAHAEMVAILNAHKTLRTKNLTGCVLYTTVEPCFMCSYLIRVSSISRVVYGTVAGETGGASSAYPILSSSTITKWKPIKVVGGVLAAECASLLPRK